MTAALLTKFKQTIQDYKLIPAGGGCFEITVNGELIYSKTKTGKFPDEKWVVENLSRLAKK